MSKKKDKLRATKIFENLEKMTLAEPREHDTEPLDLTTLSHQEIRVVVDTSKVLRMKKFRAQLLHQWLVNTFEPCRVADIGGGKGLLSHLLIQSGWQATVIDPFDQLLPDKYKDIASDRRVRIEVEKRIPRMTAAFESEMAQDYDLLIGMHAHGCNAKIIDSSEAYGCGFVILPCCIIDEPFYPPIGVHWLESLADYSVQKGHNIFPFRLNFKGQNIGLCRVGKSRLLSKH
jgi:hypothetical protein